LNSFSFRNSFSVGILNPPAPEKPQANRKQTQAEPIKKEGRPKRWLIFLILKDGPEGFEPLTS
jgi:hypothetical protein